VIHPALQIARCAIAAALVLASGCASVGPDYAPVEPALPAAWSRAVPAQFDPARRDDLSRWWKKLRDPVLSGLVEDALVANTDLKRALARLRQARAQRLFAEAGYFPTLSISAGASRARSSAQAGSGRTTELYSIGFDAGWEPDVFGGVRRGIEAAQAGLEASAASLEHTRTSLVAEVALNYVEVRAFQSRLGIAQANLASQTGTFQITDWRAQAGLVGALDVEQARASLEQTRALIPGLDTGLAEAEHRLAVLLGRPPRAA
jgi:NodT family efflux transporter outer membrane factor (OMF) lipoprotein